MNLQKNVKEKAVNGELIRFGIESLDKIADWQKKHHIQDMKFVPIPLLEKELGKVAQQIRQRKGLAEFEGDSLISKKWVLGLLVEEGEK